MKRILIMICIVIFACSGCKGTQINSNESNASIEVENEKGNQVEENIPLDETIEESEKIKDTELANEEKIKEEDDNKVNENSLNEDTKKIDDVVVTNNNAQDNVIENNMKVIAEQGLNLRSYPHINSIKIELMPFASEVMIVSDEKVRDTIDKVKGNWVKVKYNDKEGWAFDAYIKSDVEEKLTFNETNNNNIVNRCDIKTGDIINGLEVKVIEYDASTTSQIKINFKGEISLTGELVRNKMGALLIPDKEYLDVVPRINGGNEIFYIVLDNFKEAEIKNNLSENINRVQIELEEYKIKSKLLGEEEVPCYSANVLNMSDTKLDSIIGYKGKDIEGCFINDKLQIKDNICGLKVVDRSIFSEDSDLETPLYTGSVCFDGEMVLKADYNIVEELGNGYSFKVKEEDIDKIPHFETHNEPSFIIENIDETIKKALGSKGEALLIIDNFNYKWTLEDTISTADIVEMISVEKEE